MTIEEMWLAEFSAVEELIRDGFMPIKTMQKYYFYYGYLKGLQGSYIAKDDMYEIIKLLEFIADFKKDIVMNSTGCCLKDEKGYKMRIVEMNRADLVALNNVIDMGREHVIFEDSVDISDDYYYWSGYIKGLLQSDARSFDIDMDKIDEITDWLDMWDDNDRPTGQPN